MRKWPPRAVVLSLDLGSSSLKGAAFDTQGRAVAGLSAQRPCTLRYGQGGSAEVNLSALVEAAEQIMDALHLRLSERPVLAVAMTSFASSLVALDQSGQPIGAVLSYADTRAASEMAAVAREVSSEAVGCPAFSAYWPAQIRYWLSAHPHLHPHHFCSVADYLLLRWTGELSSSYSLASWTGALNRHSLIWDESACRAAGISASQLPALHDHSHAQFLTPLTAARWPKLACTPFHPAVGDGATANVGSGALGLSRVAVTIGSTSAIRVALPGAAPSIPAGLWSYRVSASWHLLGGALTEGGNLHHWLRQSLHLDQLRDLDDALLSSVPDSHGLTFVPSLGGSRSPDYNPHSRGAVLGLSYATTPLQMLQAGMESVACRLADLAGRLQPQMQQPRYLASGKALMASRAWQQMLADALGAPLQLSDTPEEASARGAALLALETAGALQLVSNADRRAPVVVEPRSANGDLYRRAAERQSRYSQLLAAAQLAEEQVQQTTAPSEVQLHA